MQNIDLFKSALKKTYIRIYSYISVKYAITIFQKSALNVEVHHKTEKHFICLIFTSSAIGIFTWYHSIEKYENSECDAALIK